MWWTVRDSNPGPIGYEPTALPTELTVHNGYPDLKKIGRHLKVAANFHGASCRTRTYDTAVNSRVLYRLS